MPKKKIGLAAPRSAESSGVDFDNDYGYRGFESNEESIGSHKDDPPKQRFTCIIEVWGGGGGAVSFNASRDTGICLGQKQVEMGLYRVEQAESVRGQIGNYRSEHNFFANDGTGQGDASMIRAFAFECDRFTKMHPGIVASLQSIIGGGSSSRMVSPNGRYWFQPVQDDGNFVQYDATDPNVPVPTFDLFWLFRTLTAIGNKIGVDCTYPPPSKKSQLAITSQAQQAQSRATRHRLSIDMRVISKAQLTRERNRLRKK